MMNRHAAIAMLAALVGLPAATTAAAQADRERPVANAPFGQQGQQAEQAEQARQAQLEEVATSDRLQWTGVAVSEDGRIFVNYPRWTDEYEHAVQEIRPDGSRRVYPDEDWNRWESGMEPAEHFVCVQAVTADGRGSLWVLDPAAPEMEEIVEGGPKLVRIDLETNEVQRVYTFDEEIAPRRSYLNDVRIDHETKTAYMTDSGMGAIIVLDLDTGDAVRLLDDHESTEAEGIALNIRGKPLKEAASGQTPKIHSDGIVLDGKNGSLYWQALTGKTLWRAPLVALRSPLQGSDPAAVAEAVERVAETVVTDGMHIDGEGNIYFTALENDAIMYRTPAGDMRTLVRDERLAWPDTMSIRDGWLYVTTARIHEMPRFERGKDWPPEEPFGLYRVRLPGQERAGVDD